jgi:hypothetical protein
MVNVQEMATFGIVGAAAVGLLRQGWLGIRSAREGHCPGCGECGRAEKQEAGVRPAPKATPLITLSTQGPPRRFRPPEAGE